MEKNKFGRRVLALLLIIGLLAPVFTTIAVPRGVYAAPSPFDIEILRARNSIDITGEAPALRVDWTDTAPGGSGVKTARVVWVDIGAGGVGGTPSRVERPINATLKPNATGNTPDQYEEITRVTLPTALFKYDVLYQIKIELYNTTDTVTGEPSLPLMDANGEPSLPPLFIVETVFLRGITVELKSVDNSNYRSLRPGEKETGYNPALECRFKLPRVFVNTSTGGNPYTVTPSGSGFYRFFGGDPDVPGDPKTVAYKTALAGVQKLRSDVNELRFDIGISNYIVSENRYPDPNRIDLYWDETENALMSTVKYGEDEIYNSKVKKEIPADDTNDWHMIYLAGRQDSDTRVPDDAEWYDVIMKDQAKRDEYIPSLSETGFASVLRFKDLYPGALCRMQAEIHFIDVNGRRILEVDGFRVTGELPSWIAFTALRIIISRISDDYVKVEIFRINLGADYMIGNGYKVTIMPDITGTAMEVTVNDFAGSHKSLQAYIKVSNPTAPYFFRAEYTRANGADGPRSAWIEYILQESGENVPIMPKGLAIERLEYDPVRKVTDVTVSWDRPANWATATSNDIYIEFNLNTSHADLEKTSELIDGEGGSYGEFTPVFRIVLAVRREEIGTPSNDRLSYVIKGDELFKVAFDPDYVPPSGVPLPPDVLYSAAFWETQMQKGRPLRSTEMYPDFLLPNTRYFLTLRTVIWLNEQGPPMESNASSAVAFTTYPTNYTPPLPLVFSVTENVIPAPPLFENSISLQALAVDWRYASTVHDPSVPIRYELYISDRPDDPKPQLAGYYNNGDPPYESWKNAGWLANMRLPPPYTAASDPADIAGALVGGTVTTSAAGRHINWNDIKKYDGERLQPNKVYFFWIRTFIIESPGGVERLNGNSRFSIMLSATTPPWPQAPDMSYRRRIAPTDFAIAKDALGNLRVTGESAVFSWSPTEADALYEFVITSVRDVNNYFMPGGSGLSFGDPALAPGLDTTYESFIREFSGDDGRASDRRLLLDPQRAGITGSGGIRGFERDPVTGIFSYTVDRWLFPNSVYFVSLRAVSRDPEPDGPAGGPPDPQRAAFYTEMNNTSPFVTLPLTTLMLDAPFNLRPVIGAEIVFAFVDDTPFTAAEYHINVRDPDQSAYALVGGSQGTVVKTGGIVYVKIVNLEFQKNYDVRVTRGREAAMAYQAEGLATRDPYHSVQVEWMGLATEPNDAFLRFQVAVISQTELYDLPPDYVEYFELRDLNLAPFKYIKDGREYGYEIFHDSRTVNMSNTMVYRATLLTKPVRMRDGSVAQRALEPNMRYYVKVRTRKISRDDAEISAFSKYAGPVETRTDFLQSSQDEMEEKRRMEDNLLDKLAEYERETYYIVDSGDRTQGKYLLKEDKIIGLIRTTPYAGYLIDVSENLKRADADTVYIPGGILLALQEYDKTIAIRFEGAEYVLSRNTIDLRYEKIYTDMARKAGTSEFLVRLRELRSDFAGSRAPSGSEGITGIHKMEAMVIASHRSYANIYNVIQEYIFNERTGLLNQKLNALSYRTDGTSRTWSGAVVEQPTIFDTEEAQNRARNAEIAARTANDAYVDELASDIKNLTSTRIGDILEGRNGFRPLAAASVNITDFNAPLIVTLQHTRYQNGKISPFISYDGKEWFKLTQNITQRPNAISFEAISPGYFSAVLATISTAGIPEGTYVEAALINVASRYDLGDIFPGINRDFQPELPVLNREAAFLYERVLGLEGDTFGMNIAQRITALGLQDIMKPNAPNAQMDRQRAAVLVTRLYAGVHGHGSVKIMGSGRSMIRDAGGVEPGFIDAVEFCVGKGLMKLSAGNFEPGRSVTRAELVTALAGIQ